MSDETVENFEVALEHDIERLTEELKTRREHPEMQGVSGRELVKQSIQAIAPQPQSGGTPAGQAAPTNVFQNPLPDYASGAPPEVKLEIEHLLETAFRHGILKASAEAAKSSAFVLDTFHDALAGKLYPELKKRGIVE